jgi:hypothetical protein
VLFSPAYSGQGATLVAEWLHKKQFGFLRHVIDCGWAMSRTGGMGRVVMTTIVTFLEALIVSVTILCATYCLVHLGLCCARWAIRSIGPHALKRAARPHGR